MNSIITNERRASLVEFLEAHSTDLVFLSETKINPKHKLSFRDFSLIRTDRPNSKQGGGTAILIRTDIKFNKIIINKELPNAVLEYTILETTIADNSKLYFISTYAPGNSKKVFVQELECLFKKLKRDDPNNYYLLAGDLNAKHASWDNESANTRGAYLHSWHSNKEIDYRISLRGSSSPSFPKSGAFIDLCLVDSRISFHDLVDGKIECVDYDSDHKALRMCVSIDRFPTSIRYSRKLPENEL